MVAGYLILAGMIVVGVASIAYAVHSLPITNNESDSNIPPPGLY